jgi:predicted tellurium resistance membrane protein TerC
VVELFTAENGIALLTLTALEIVLGIDNIVFLSILTSKLPAHQRVSGQRIGLSLAMVMRIGLLFAISWIVGLTRPLFEVFSWVVSGRDLILLGGGLFLIGKATWEIHDKLEGAGAHAQDAGGTATFGSVLVQVALIDMVFSLDSVITAVGMARELSVMVAAVVASVGVMMVFAAPISTFIERHPTMKILALSFLLLIGVMLVLEGLGTHVGKGYIYFAMAFSLGVELLNLRLRARRTPVHLRQSYVGPAEDDRG